MTVAHLSPLRCGEVVAVLRRFEFEPFLKSIEQFQLNDVLMVPPVAIAMINMVPIVKKYSLQSIRLVTFGAAPLTKDSQMRLKALLPANAQAKQVYGMTESSCVATVSSPGPQFRSFIRG